MGERICAFSAPHWQQRHPPRLKGSDAGYIHGFHFSRSSSLRGLISTTILAEWAWHIVSIICTSEILQPITENNLFSGDPCMVLVKRLVLDVLKPHTPNSLDFARTLAEQGSGYQVKFTVMEVDENTETVEVVIEGKDIDFDAIAEAINELGGSLHSIDEVEVINSQD
jgi:hypothetical protein